MLIKFSIIFCNITYLSSFSKRERSCFSLQKCKKDNAKLLKIIFPSNALKSYISYIRFDRDRAAFIISKCRAKPADFAGVVIKLAPFWKSRDNATWRNSGLAGILSSQQIVGWPNPVITIRVGFAPFPPSLLPFSLSFRPFGFCINCTFTTNIESPFGLWHRTGAVLIKI